MAKKKFSKQIRYLWPNVIRAIAIYLVILAHTNTPPIEQNLINIISYSIYSFLGLLSVPLFVIVSGALLLPKQEGYLIFFIKRIRRVVIPWLFWSILLTIWYIYLGRLEATGVIEYARAIYRTAFSMYWFLPMLFGLYILTPILRIFITNSSRRDLIYTIGIWAMAISLGPLILGIFFLINSYVIQFLGYYLLGVLLTSFKKVRKYKMLVGFLIVLVISPIYFIFFKPEDISAANILFSHISPLIVVGSSILFLILYLFLDKKQVNQNSFFENTISSMGKVSLGIYLIHPFMIEVFAGYFKIHDILSTGNSFFLTPLFALLIFLLSYFVIYALRRIFFLRPLVG